MLLHLAAGILSSVPPLRKCIKQRCRCRPAAETKEARVAEGMHVKGYVQHAVGAAVAERIGRTHDEVRSTKYHKINGTFC